MKGGAERSALHAFNVKVPVEPGGMELTNEFLQQVTF